jgi:hypothetical protein
MHVCFDTITTHQHSRIPTANALRCESLIFTTSSNLLKNEQP